MPVRKFWNNMRTAVLSLRNRIKRGQYPDILHFRDGWTWITVAGKTFSLYPCGYGELSAVIIRLAALSQAIIRFN